MTIISVTPPIHRTSTGILRAFAAALVLATIAAGPVLAQRFDSKAGQVLLIDMETGTVLFDKSADVRMPPASMAKLMTLEVVFEALDSGQLAMDDVFMVSETAWREGGASSGGSTMFAELGSEISVADLLRGVIIQSGNDACIVLAEGMAGTEATFANIMNQSARRLKLNDSHFANSTGLPHPDQYVTAWDLARLSKHLITAHADNYAIFSEENFTWNKITQRNRNPLVAMKIGVDGLKTGYTEASGYGLVGSAQRDGRRLIVVINGAESAKQRAEEGRKLLEWGFRAFERVSLFARNEVIGEANVFGGAASGVGVVSRGGVDVLLPRGSSDLLKGRVHYQGPVEAPIEEGQEIGVLRITMDGKLLKEQPVFAAEDIDGGSLPQRAVDGLQELLLGWW
ncbi:MAG: D-alanyl-D-alanine carboxypeptidase family protein [Alphaproteobacteria bacterium]